MRRFTPGIPQATAELAGFFASPLLDHPADGAVKSIEDPDWVAAAIEKWLAEGWTHSTLADLQSDRINRSTIVFKAKWRDSYDDGSIEFVCGWYQADYERNRWHFTQHADIDCDEHRL